MRRVLVRAQGTGQSRWARVAASSTDGHDWSRFNGTSLPLAPDGGPRRGRGEDRGIDEEAESREEVILSVTAAAGSGDGASPSPHKASGRSGSRR